MKINKNKTLICLFLIMTICILYFTTSWAKEKNDTVVPTTHNKNENINKENLEIKQDTEKTSTDDFDINETKSNEKETKKEKEYVGYIKSTTNVYQKPDTKSSKYSTYYFNKKITYTEYNSKWVKIKLKNKTGYILKKDVTKNKYTYKKYEVPNNVGYFKSFISYKAITNKKSNQYKLQSKYANTGSFGIRMVDNRYCIAVGTYFKADIGDYADILLENGTVIPVVISEIKSNQHTDKLNIATSNGCVTEFIVDKNYLGKKLKKMGDMSFLTKEWNSKVKEIKVYNKNVFE